MSLRQRLRSLAESSLGKKVTPFIGWSFIAIDTLLFDDYIYGNITIWANNTSIRVFGPLLNEGEPHLIARTIGAVGAFLIIAPMVAFMCRLFLSWYDYWGINWLGVEGFKEFEEDERKHGWWTRFRLWVMSWGEIPALVVLSLWKDAFVTTAVLRKKENRYNGLTKRDKRIFWASVFISVGYWSLRWSFITLVVQYVFPHLPPWLQEVLLWLWNKNVEFMEWVGATAAAALHGVLDFGLYLIAPPAY